MVTMEVLMDILVLDRQGLSVRAIARKLGIHRKTAKKYLEAGGPPVYRKEKRKGSILDPYRPAIRDWLAEDNFRATWIYERLRSLGYTGSYDTVKTYVREVKEQASRNRSGTATERRDLLGGVGLQKQCSLYIPLLRRLSQKAICGRPCTIWPFL